MIPAMSPIPHEPDGMAAQQAQQVVPHAIILVKTTKMYPGLTNHV